MKKKKEKEKRKKGNISPFTNYGKFPNIDIVSTLTTAESSFLDTNAKKRNGSKDFEWILPFILSEFYRTF